uniref:Secreted protein n=1 Tax=Cucumis melo TaxID=3656 RepID=A0A9I9CTY9_CUCME
MTFVSSITMFRLLVISHRGLLACLNCPSIIGLPLPNHAASKDAHMRSHNKYEASHPRSHSKDEISHLRSHSKDEASHPRSHNNGK